MDTKKKQVEFLQAFRVVVVSHQFQNIVWKFLGDSNLENLGFSFGFT